MKVSICLATYGSETWAVKAASWAFPSALKQGAFDIVFEHGDSLAAARNTAASRADGDWLCFLDADDQLGDGYVAAMQAATEVRPSDGPVLMVPRVRYMHDEGGVWSGNEPLFPNKDQAMDEVNHCVIGTLVRKDLFEAVGGFGNEPIYEDWALWLRCMRAGADLLYVRAAVYNAFVRTDGRNSQLRDAVETYNRIRAEHRALVS